MNEDFEQHLSKVKGKIRRISASSRYTMHDAALLSYLEKAENLRSGALVLWHAYNNDCPPFTSQALGLRNGHSLVYSLPPIFGYLAGSSIELLLKGICKAIDRPAKQTHKLIDLCNSSGISFNGDDQIILSSMTEHIYWAARYPTPKTYGAWVKAQEIFQSQRRSHGTGSGIYIKERIIDLDNYNRIWEKLFDCFFRAQQSTFESVEFP